MFQSTPQTPGSEKDINNIVLPDIATLVSYFLDFFNQFKEVDTTIIATYWSYIVFIMKTIVFLCVIWVSWNWIICPFLKNRRLEKIRQEL
jgi:hypothetical protein